MSSHKKWTAEEIELLRRLYPCNLTKNIAHYFGVDPKAITRMAFRCRIKKNPEIKARSGEDGWFWKGQTAFNKGKKQKDYMSEAGQKRCAMTQFKSGHIPNNTRPMYSERMSKDGYIEIKIPGHKKFVPKHRWVWESNFGPIPKGYQIHFIDGDRTNFDISNLEMISNAENARRNSHWNKYPEEIATLIQLKGALARQINKHNKSNQ